MPYTTNVKPVQFAIEPVTQVTADGNSSTLDLQALGLEGDIVISFDANNTAGSSPTLAIKMQESDDDSTYTDVSGGGFTSLTTDPSTQSITLNKDKLKRYLQVNYDIGGTSSPSYDVSVVGLGFKKYPS